MVREWNHEESMVSSLRGEPGSFLCARPFPVDARTVWPSALPQTVGSSSPHGSIIGIIVHRIMI